MGVERVTEWSKTRSGRALELYHSSHVHLERATNAMIFIGGVHGDEPEGIALAQGLLTWLQELGSDHTTPTWILIPCLNPDGAAAGQRVNGEGVDLNRNYPARSWSPEAKAPRYYPGSAPGSEPEIQSLVKLIHTQRPKLLMHFHSWNPCIVVTGPPAISIGELLSQASGYPLTETIGYDTPGSLSEFGWQDNSIPVVCIEEQEGAPLDSVWPRFKPAFEKLFSPSFRWGPL